MFIYVFNYVCLKGCHPPEMQGCWHEGRLVKLLTFCLPGRNFDQCFFRAFPLFPTKWPKGGVNKAHFVTQPNLLITPYN